ncbi:MULTISPECIES: sugar ABC transporter substrate-binding protein [Atopobiaceae]|uniref:Ribose transport system substrate-binding protein n=1 Tax=Parafannyhessea umbonata TaxID=604330 RepID=A0A1H9PJD3_9ACTN|nr:MULTISPECIES: substrate-binding domain-containing protein [Atopobiaceae]SEH51131.1 ribose transport system substrate-binding protein [Parafannyhessea umbonata]SER48406.1 ribose transport system substrate-binding protein [Parafannyhessea umbonata]SJZ75551.1 ribose transport system substrate-binding protein [Olsenella sp. KH1P3]
MGNLSRRDFLKLSGVTGAGLGASALLAACNGGGGSDDGGDGASGEGKKIGISIWSSTDALGSLSVAICKKAADILGCEVQTVDQGHVSEQVTASAETLAAAGCNGMIICNSADSEMTSVINTCNENEMYVTQFYRIISEEASPDVYEVAKNSKFYVGAVHEDEVLNGKTLMGLLLEKGGPNKTGARNICLEGWTVGDATFQLRWQGYKEGLDEWNQAHPDDQATMTEPVYANTSSAEGAKVTEQFVNTNPNMDALIVAGGGGDPLVGSIGQLANMGKTGQISVVSTDFLEDLADQLESGGIFAESGGHFCDPLYAFILTYQACTGKLEVKDGEFGKEIKFPYVYVSSSDEYKDYAKYFVDDAPYNEDEIKALAEDDFDALCKAAESLSIEDVKKRHA